MYKKRINPLRELTDDDFRRRYRFSKENMCRIIDILRADLQIDNRGSSIPIDLQVMAVVRYWGRHEIQEDCADIHGMSQQTLSRLARKVAIALASKCSQYIKMPSTISEEATAIQKFESVSGLPGIIGAIDCTHIQIRKVGGDLEQYDVNRKGRFSINTQVCHWRGSTHDARIYRESSIKRRFEEHEFSGKLVGDSGYPRTPHLLTPILRPSTDEDRHYNNQHIQARNVVERCFGVWKQRFRILLQKMRGGYATIKTTIVACAVLHNLAIIFNEHQVSDIMSDLPRGEREEEME